MRTYGERYEETGRLNENEGQWSLRRDEGGRWRLELGFYMRWKSRHLIGKRVRLAGIRSGYDELKVEKILPL